jgi:hypothetical protein
MTILELFCGTKSISKEFKDWNTITVDYDSQFEPDICGDVSNLKAEDFKDIDFIWASPDCSKFSVSSIGKYWNTDHTPKTPESEAALELLTHTINLILEINPTIGFIIENPVGKMRKMPIMEQFRRYTVHYCQYGDVRQKPTDLWSNLDLQFKPVCKRGSPCHISAPRGSRTGTQGMNKIDKGRLPKELCKSIYEQINELRTTKTDNK